MLVARRLCLGGGRLIALRVLGPRTISPLSGELLFFACAKKSNQKKAHPGSGAPSGFPAMLGPKGPLANSAPYRRLRQRSLLSRLGPALLGAYQGARYVHGTALRAAPLSPGPSPARGEGKNSQSTLGAMSAQPTSRGGCFAVASAFDVGPLGMRREAQESGGMEVADCSKRLWGAEFGDVPPAPSIAGDLAQRGAGLRVCFLLVGFSLHKQRKVTRPTGRNSARTSATQARSGERFHTNHPPSLALPTRGRGQSQRTSPCP